MGLKSTFIILQPYLPGPKCVDMDIDNAYLIVPGLHKYRKYLIWDAPNPKT